MKPSNEDITFLKDYENNFNCSNDENQKSDFFWPQKFANYFQSQKIINPQLDEKSLKIKKLLNIIGIENISYRKLSALYKERYNAIISKTNVNEILKYKWS